MRRSLSSPTWLTSAGPIAPSTAMRGHGRMLGKLLDRVTVADGKGDEFDVGELTTYLNDAILMAPSMLFGPVTSWNAVDDGSFDVSLSDGGHTVSGRVLVDERAHRMTSARRPVRGPPRRSGPGRMAHP